MESCVISKGIVKKKRSRTYFLVFSFLMYATTSFAQNISLSLTEEPIEKAFQSIEAQTKFRFIYSKETIRKAKPVSLHLTDVSLPEALTKLFSDQPLGYSIEDAYIMVKANQIKTSKKIFEIRGKVINEKGNGIAGASVSVKGGTEGAATDEKGDFSLKTEKENPVLLVSSVGYEPEEVSVVDNSYTVVELKTAVGKLDETVVIAYGTTTKRLATGNISKIPSEVISEQPVDNPIAAIQGRAPGVFVTTLNGMPDGNIKVEIRGKASIAGGTEPLYVIDGIPYSSTPLNKGFADFMGVNGEVSPLSNLNPADIQSIEVLKDADATAIYGSRGANGVVLITTKKGKPGKTKLDVDISQGFSRLATFPKFLNVRDYLQLRREAFKNDGITPTPSNAPELFLWDSTSNQNWSKYVWGGTANRTNIQTSISGGIGGTSFLISGHYRTEGTVLMGNENYATAGGHAVIEHTSLNKKFSLQFSASYNADKNNLIVPTTLSVIGLPPNFPLYDSAGNINWIGAGSSDNPVAMISQRSKANNTSFVSNTSIQYAVLNNLKLKTNFGYTSSELDQMLTVPKFTINPSFSSTSNWASFGNNKIRDIIAEPQINYAKRYYNSSIDVLFGASYEHSVRTGTLVKATDFSNEELLESMGAAGQIEYTRSIYTEYKYASLFSRINYVLKDRYLFNGTVRRDGSSRFGPGKQFGNFGSLGLGWIFSGEPAIKKLFPFLSYGKIRGSYGVTGNDQIPDYQYLSTYRSGAIYQEISGLSPSVISNDLYSWETNRKLEAAIEMGFLKDRIFLNVSYYRNRSGNQLVGFPLPYQTGFSSFQSNLPALVQNTGIESEFSAEIIRHKKFSWNTSFNITKPKNKLVSFPGIQASAYANTLVVGQDINVVKGYHFLGVDPSTGLAEYEDINRDGKISQPLDYIVIGKTTPDYYGGFGQHLSLGSLSVDLFFQFVKQRSRGAEMFPGLSRNQFTTVLQRWQEPGDNTMIPRASTTPGKPGFTSNANLAFSDAFFYDASYLRFKNLSLSYLLPDRVIRRLNLQRLRVYANGQNLFTIKRKVNLNDPETLQGGMPPLRTIVAGIQLTF